VGLGGGPIKTIGYYGRAVVGGRWDEWGQVRLKDGLARNKRYGQGVGTGGWQGGEGRAVGEVNQTHLRGSGSLFRRKTV